MFENGFKKSLCIFFYCRMFAFVLSCFDLTAFHQQREIYIIAHPTRSKFQYYWEEGIYMFKPGWAKKAKKKQTNKHTRVNQEIFVCVWISLKSPFIYVHIYKFVDFMERQGKFLWGYQPYHGPHCMHLKIKTFSSALPYMKITFSFLNYVLSSID